ncbi:MAG TPA: hypothetical protein DDY45_08850, partial [Verrucomicrobiales bacterium]|nr:hypothetical protein [Verrucomicrobiales bacterium]
PIAKNAIPTTPPESGDGRHNDTKRELSGVFHAITGTNGRLKTGQILDIDAQGLDVYNTMARTTGTTAKLGPQNRPVKLVDKIIA